MGFVVHTECVVLGTGYSFERDLGTSGAGDR